MSKHILAAVERVIQLVFRQSKMSGSELPVSRMDRFIAPRPAWRHYGPYVVGAVVIAWLAVWLLSGTGGHVYRIPIDRLTISTVTEGPFEDFIAVRGIVVPFITSYLTTDQGGTVKEVLVEDGAIVKRGQPLVILSNPALQLQVASQQLSFEQTRFKYEHDVLDIDHQISRLNAALARDKILMASGAIAPSTYREEQEEYKYYKELRAATIASRDIEQKIRATQLIGKAETGGSPHGINIANAAIEALTIRAPMDGQLTALDAEIGQSKTQGSVLGQVDSLDRFKLAAQVDEFYLGRVVLGQETLFTIAGRDYKAEVAKIYPKVANGTFKADFYFVGAPPSGVHTGQAVEMKVELGGAARAIILPNGPFYQDTGGNWVFVVSPDGRFATRRNVRLGRRNPEYVEVRDGIKPGERVIVSGYEAFQTMDRVEFESAQGAN